MIGSNQSRIMKSNVELGEKIRKIRSENNMSQQRFGKKLGISGKSVSAYETGRIRPPLRVLEDISSTYNVSVFRVHKEKGNSISSRILEIKNSIAELEDMFSNGLSL
jgi:transcriptional regulator with XRE-family HTH domain